MAVRHPPVESPPLTYSVAELFPREGEWSEVDYLALDSNRVVELADGRLEVVQMPTDFHQLILGRLFSALFDFVLRHGLGQVRFAPLRVRLWEGRFREPDLVFMAAAHADRLGEQYWGPPDLAVEVLSPDNPDHDRVTKKQEYAQAGIPEYWIVDPEDMGVEIYRLQGQQYELERALHTGDVLTSPQLSGFEMALEELFAEA